MTPTLFSSVDVADARDCAMDFAATQADLVTHVRGPLTASQVLQVKQDVSPLHLQVVSVDGVSPSATAQLLTLVRKGLVVGYTTKIKHCPGVVIHRSGLHSNDRVYVSLTQSGMRPAEAAQCARIGRGSVDRAAQGLAMLSARHRTIALLDAVRAHNLSAVHEAAAALTGADIELVRAAVHEIRSGDFALWAPHEVEILTKHINFVESTVGTYFVKSPATAALTLSMGLYYAECGLL